MQQKRKSMIIENYVINDSKQSNFNNNNKTKKSS